MKKVLNTVLSMIMALSIAYTGLIGAPMIVLAAETDGAVVTEEDTTDDSVEETEDLDESEKESQDGEEEKDEEDNDEVSQNDDGENEEGEEETEASDGDDEETETSEGDDDESDESIEEQLITSLASATDEELDLTELEEEAEEEEEEKEKPHKLKKTDIDGVTSATQSKFNNALDFKSAKSYGGLYEDKFEAAAYLLPASGEEEGAFVAAGYTFGASDDPDWDFTTNMEASPQYGHSYNEAIVVCFDSDHDVKWTWESTHVGVSYFLGVDVIADGSIVAVGRVRDYESTRTAMYIVKINPNDKDDYTEYIINSTSGAGYELNGIVPTDDGGFAVSGYTSYLTGYIASSEDGFSTKTQIWQNASGEDEELSKRASDKGFNGCLIKFDKDFNVEFASFENYGVMEDVADSSYSNPTEKIRGLDIDEDGNFITVGITQLAKGNANAVIAKWDGLTGELIAHRMAGTANPTAQDSIDLITAEYLSVAVLDDGTYVVTGTATNDATTGEDWKCYGSTDVVVVRYSADLDDVLFARNIGTVDGLSGSLTANAGTQMEGVTATSDGGYVVFGTSNTTIVERDLLDEGYTWDNYGANDGIIIKYDSSNNVSWVQNYGTTGGDWIYDVINRENETEVTVVGQTSGQYGTPAWEWHGQAASSSNPYDAFVMCTNYYEKAYTESKASTELSGVTWANGTYTGEGVGRGGTMTFNVVIENNMISSIECISHSETTEGGDTSPYARASTLYSTIVEQQTTEVDAVSGATLTSSGIKSGVTDALAKASAQTAINAIDKIAGYTSANTSTTGNINNVLAAINYYTALTDYEREYVTNSDTLYSIAEIFGFDIEITQSEEEEEEETVDTTLNDTYWSLQSKYYDDINGNGLAEHGLTGSGVKIAVIDSGLICNSADIDYHHILAGWDYVNDSPMNDPGAENNEELTDPEGHGTFVTGIIVAKRDNNIGIAGLLSDVDIIPMRIDSGASEEASKAAGRAIVEAVDKFDADVITTSVSLLDTEELKAAVDYANSCGVIVVGASGNSGVSGSTEDAYIYPASYDSVISVGAVDNAGNVRVNSTKNDQVYVTAPGQQILSLGLSARGYRCFVKSGTSYSSPIVAAMAAAAKQANPDITPDEFKELLQTTSQDKGDEGYDNSYGYGLVDLAAFAQEIAPLPEQPSENTDISEPSENNTTEEITESSETGNSSSNSGSSGSSSSTSSASSSATQSSTEEAAVEVVEETAPDETIEETTGIQTASSSSSNSSSSQSSDAAEEEVPMEDAEIKENTIESAASNETNNSESDSKQNNKKKKIPVVPIAATSAGVAIVAGAGIIFKKTALLKLIKLKFFK